MNNLVATGLTHVQALAQLNRKQQDQIWRSRRSGLAAKYAREAVDYRRKDQLNGNMGGVWECLNKKYWHAWKACWSRIRSAPRWKKRSLSVVVGVAAGKNPIITKYPNRNHEAYVNVSALLLPRYRNNDRIRRVKIIQHRPLPDDAVVKDLKVIRTSHSPSARWYVVLAIKTERGRIDFPSTGLACGVDPGLKTAAVVAGEDCKFPGTDGFDIDPGKPFRHTLEKLRRLQRQLDRQIRANNPQCFDERGVWKKGARISVWSNGIRETQVRISEIQARAASIRLECYNQAANSILERYDTVFIGNYSDGTPKTKAKLRKKRKKAFAKDGTRRAKGQAQRERTINQIARDNALGILRRLLKEKAQRSLTPKQIIWAIQLTQVAPISSMSPWRTIRGR